MTIISRFIIRYYYFFKDEPEPLERLAKILSEVSLANCSTASVNFFDQTSLFFQLNFSRERMKVLAVKIENEENSWINELNELDKWEEQAELGAEDLMGKLTVLAGTDSTWTALTEEAAAIITCDEPIGINLDHGIIAYFPEANKNDESFYLCALEDLQPNLESFLLRRLPLYHANAIRLRLLDGRLRDRNMIIRQEKEELERNLSHILHSKLVMTNAAIMATEELESEIEALATAFAKLMSDQNLVADGIKRLQTMLDDLEKLIMHDNSLENPAVLFTRLTETYQQRRDDLLNTQAELIVVRDNFQAAIEVVQSKIDIMNSRTNIATQDQIKGLLEINTAMQKQSLIFQYAAGLIEFIVLAYYSHTLWSHLVHAAYLAVPAWVQFIVVMLFSGNTVIVTHFLAEYMQGDRHILKKLIAAAFPLLIMLIFIVTASAWLESHGAAH